MQTQIAQISQMDAFASLIETDKILMSLISERNKSIFILI